MVKAAVAAGLDWQLLYLARNTSDFIFLEDLQQLDRSRIKAHASDVEGQFDLQKTLLALDGQTTVYSCGPQGLLNALESY